jgi:hypothetical protein
MVGDFEVQRERTFWLEKDGEMVAGLRLGLEIGRSDATIIAHLQGNR